MSPSTNTDPNSELSPHQLHANILDAATTGDEAKLKSHLDQWKQRKLESKIINACLLGAVGANDSNSVRILLEYGAEVTPSTISRAIEVQVATNVWAEFLNYGWDIKHAMDKNGRPVLTRFLDDSKMLQWLLDHGASPNVCGKTGLSTVTSCAAFGTIDQLKILLDHGGELAGSNALHEAASVGDVSRLEMMQLLVDERQMDVNEMSDYGPRRPRNGQADGRPLHKALYGGRRDHIEWLLEKGAKPDEVDEQGLDAEGFAKEWGYEEAFVWVREWPNNSKV